MCHCHVYRGLCLCCHYFVIFAAVFVFFVYILIMDVREEASEEAEQIEVQSVTSEFCHENTQVLKLEVP